MPTRRHFLGLLAAPAFAQISALERRAPAQRILILGGGLAGLCSAYELQQQGHDVTVLEAQLRPGGRVRTLRENLAPGLYVEAGAEAIPGAHEITQHYAKTLGLTLVPHEVPGARSLYHLQGRRIIPDAQTVWPFDLTAEERELGMAGLSRKYIAAAVTEAQSADWTRDPASAMKPWDAQTPGAWLRSKGASRGAAQLLTLGFGLEFGSAASYLLHAVNSRGAGARTHVEGGNDRLPAAFAAKITTLRYGAPVRNVRQDDRAVHVTLATGQTLDADRAICALPCPAIGAIFADARLSPAKQTAIREQSYSRTVKVFLQSRTRFWLADRFSGNATTDLAIERLTPDPGDNPAGRGALTAYPIGPYAATLEQMSETARVAAAYEQARQIFPDLAAQYEGGISQAWGADPWQRGAFALHTPGQIGYLAILARPEGRIHFAGEHTSAWTGWMQGALDSARRVVREING
jgi:monoamine oxidase